MVLYAVSGTLTDVHGEMNWFMPGLAVGTFFCGTMTVTPDPSNPHISTAVLHVIAGGHLVNATSIGLDPLEAFADHTPTGPLSSPTVQHGAIDNVFFKLTVSGASLGTTGFTVQGPGPDGSSKAGGATGTITSIVAR
jgi:hypothetical protein